MKALKRFLTVLSVAGNVLLVTLVVFSASRTTRFISYYDMAEGYTTGACIVSVPEQGALVFAPVELSLKTGEQAALQFSALKGGGQLNLVSDPLYDRSVVSIETSGYGLVIRALKPGETVLQAVTGGGIRDIARVTVEENP